MYYCKYVWQVVDGHFRELATTSYSSHSLAPFGRQSMSLYVF